MNVETLMRVSYLEAMNSPDPSTQNGAVLVDNLGYAGTIIGIGHNHFPAGISPAHWSGPKQGKYDRVVHAEVASLLNAAQNGRSTADSHLICGWAACSNCAKHIVDAGVKELIRHSFEQNVGTTGNYWTDDCILGDEIMREGGVKITEILPVSTDIVLLRNGEDWRP